MICSQLQRDLAWVMNSPSLITSSPTVYLGDVVSDEEGQAIFVRAKNWLSHLADLDVMALGKGRGDVFLLGRYFEALIALYLQNSPQFDLIARNLIIGQPGLQLGEFDFIFRDKDDQKIYHWEVSVKFYLFEPKTQKLLGPNPKDSLDKKLAKVFNQQLTLSQRPMAQIALQELGVERVFPKAFIKGYLFYPANGDWQNYQSHYADLSQDHLRGWWCYADQLHRDLPQKNESSRWCVLEKSQWLSSVFSEDEIIFTRSQLIQYLNDYFSANYKALMLVELEYVNGQWLALNRGFVVDDAWCEKEKAVFSE